jgi:hypothetical protein
MLERYKESEAIYLVFAHPRFLQLVSPISSFTFPIHSEIITRLSKMGGEMYERTQR